MEDKKGNRKRVLSTRGAAPEARNETRGSIRIRLATRFAVIGILLAVVTYQYLRPILLRRVVEIESSVTAGRLENAKKKMDARLAQFVITQSDWARSDDTHNFLKNGTKEGVVKEKYVQTHLQPATLAHNQIDFVCFFAKDNTKFYKRAVDRDTKQALPDFPDNLIEDYLSQREVGNDFQEKVTSGYFVRPEGLHLVVSSPITPANGRVDIENQGVLLFMHRFSRAEIKEIGDEAQIDLRVVSVPEAPEVIGAFTKAKPIVIRSTKDDNMAAYMEIKDIGWKANYLLVGTCPREFYAYGAWISNTIIIAIFLVMLLFTIVSLWSIERFVLRLTWLDSSLSKLSNLKDPGVRLPIEGEDEVATVAQSVNSLLDTMQAIQDDLAHSEASLLETQRLARLGTWEYDTLSGVVTWSPEVFAMVGWQPTSDWRVKVPDCQKMVPFEDWKRLCNLVNRSIKDGEPFQYECRFTRPNGQQGFAIGTAKPIKNPQGQIGGLWGSIQDFTDRKRSELVLKENEERFAEQNRLLQEKNQQLEERQAELVVLNSSLSDAYATLEEVTGKFQDLYQGLPVPCFTFDVEGRIHDWNKACEELTGYSAADIAEMVLWDTFYLPLVLEAGREKMQKVFFGSRIQGDEWEIRCADKSVCYVLHSAYPLHGAQGHIIGAIGTFVDISVRKRMESALVRSRERFDLAVQGSKSGLWEWNLLTDEVYLSTQWKRMLGFSDEEFPNRIPSWHERIHPDDLKTMLRLSQEYWAKRISEFEIELRILHRDGTYRWIQMRGIALWDTSGRAYRFAGSHTDITDRKLYEAKVAEQVVLIQENTLALELQRAELMALNRRLEALATQDGLTGIKNHRALQEHLEAALQSSVRYGEPLSFMFLDVDDFKKYNDKYGHPAGDEVLRRVAKILQANVRNTDFVARYGGEEFAIVLTHTDMEGASEFGERLRKMIEEAPWPNPPVTVSIGISTRRDEVVERKQFVMEADIAMYASKGAGKNRTAHYDSLKTSLLRKH